jgi:hypothetical protein
MDAFLTQQLLRQPPPRRLRIDIALIDRNWRGSKRLTGSSSQAAKFSLRRIMSFIQEHQEEMTRCHWSINVYSYRYTPHLFGILIKDSPLFVGRSFWDGNVLRGGSNEIEVFENRDAHGSQKIAEFKGWFEKSKQRPLILNNKILGAASCFLRRREPGNDRGR